MWAVLGRGDVWTGRLVNRNRGGTLFEEESTISPVRDAAGRIRQARRHRRDTPITIETRKVDLDAEYAASRPPTRPGPYLMLAVTDTGSGMDAATQAHIFEPFFTTKEVGKGTGLGLSTVYGIVKQSEGNVWVYSEVGVGTTFKIYLPRVDEAAVLAQETPPGPVRRGDETVLLIEDEASLRELLREALEANGHSVLVARDGAEALRIAEAHAGPIHIVVTDVIMPGMTGPRTVDLVSQARPGMKVIYISAQHFPVRRRALRADPGHRRLGHVPGDRAHRRERARRPSARAARQHLGQVHR
jgi:CheY-like chemotaxis protein